MQCEMCGRDDELFVADIEGSELKVCRNCARHGKILRRIHVAVQGKVESQPRFEGPQRVQLLVTDYGDRIRRKREALGLTQKDFALKVNEKESLLHKIETNSFEPSIPLARKLEKLLTIKLVEEVEEGAAGKLASRSGSLTIGDLIKVK